MDTVFWVTSLSNYLLSNFSELTLQRWLMIRSQFFLGILNLTTNWCHLHQFLIWPPSNKSWRKGCIEIVGCWLNFLRFFFSWRAELVVGTGLRGQRSPSVAAPITPAANFPTQTKVNFHLNFPPDCDCFNLTHSTLFLVILYLKVDGCTSAHPRHHHFPTLSITRISSH